MVTFNHPIMIVVAVLLSLGFFVASIIWRNVQTRAIERFGTIQTLRRFSRFTAKIWMAFLWAIAIGSMGVAAGEPVLSTSENLGSPTLNAMVVIDVSRSMMAKDGPGKSSRLEAAINAVDALFSQYPDGRFGLIVYTSEIFVYPPTEDHAAIITLLHTFHDNYEAQTRGEGSNIIGALDGAVKLLKSLPYPIDPVYLISDGGQSLVKDANRPSLESVMENLRNLGVHVVSVGIGGLIPVPIPVYNQKGEFLGYHEYNGSTAYTALDETLLRHIADETKGWYVHLSGDTDLVSVAKTNHLDNQPAVADTDISLVWLPVAISFFLVALLLLTALPGTTVRSIVRPRIS